MMNFEEIAQRVFPFFDSIGIAYRFGPLEKDCFLPGLSIENGVIVIDRDRILYPGDILHEAGHIAVVPAAERKGLTAASIASRTDNAAEEMMAIAWSYAAAVHTGVDPYTVFHEEGYKGGGQSIADSFSNGNYFGVPMLQWTGMCANNEQIENLRVNPYPYMLSWLRK